MLSQESKHEHPSLSRGVRGKPGDFELLLEGIGVRQVLRRLLVQVRDHLLSGRWNSNSALEHDGFRFEFLAIEALVAVIVRANGRAFQREPGEEAARAGIAQDFRAHRDIRGCICGASLWTSCRRRIGAQLYLAAQNGASAARI